jgi:hypothetical protein
LVFTVAHFSSYFYFRDFNHQIQPYVKIFVYSHLIQLSELNCLLINIILFGIRQENVIKVDRPKSYKAKRLEDYICS